MPQTIPPRTAVAAVAAVAAAAAVAAVAAVAEIDMIINNHPRLLLQFHLTGRCNLRCKHCYRAEGDVEPLTYQNVIEILEQFKDLLKKYNKRHRIKNKGHVNITGGEPFIRGDIREILEYLGQNGEHYTYGILSNGSFIDGGVIETLKRTNAAFVQLSIDGNREMHDSLRAEGDYDRVFATAKTLEKNGVRTMISFTANKENFRYLPLVAKECRKRKISKLWSDRLVPIGNGKELSSLTIDRETFPEYQKALKKAQGNALTRALHPKSCVTMNRALQFIDSNGYTYHCGAGRSLITVDEFGNVMPCRRLPIHCGSALTDTLSNIYFNNETFRTLRYEIVPRECKNCPNALSCLGGARCQSYAHFGSYFRADPACPLANF